MSFKWESRQKKEIEKPSYFEQQTPSMSIKAVLLLMLAASALVLAARPANQQFQISGTDEHSYGAVVSGRVFEPSAESFELQHSARVSRRAQPLPKALQKLEQAISHLQDTANMKHVSSVSFNAKLGMGTKKALEFSHPLVMRRAKDFEPEVSDPFCFFFSVWPLKIQIFLFCYRVCT
jgi:hypothetical protein